MRALLRRHWFLIGLVLLLPLGIHLGHQASFPLLAWLVSRAPTSLCTGGILFLMSVTLDTGQLVRALKDPAAVLTACIISMLILPLMCLPLLPVQRTPDFRVGLLIACSVPCTMAAASVWTRRAGGNDAVSLLVTLTTNGTCFLITPVWMEIGRLFFDTADTSSAMTFRSMMLRLVMGALLPAAAGQIVRLFPNMRTRVDSRRQLMSNTAQAVILSLVFVSSYRGGGNFDFDSSGLLPLRAVGTVWLSCMALHLAAAAVAWTAGRILKFPEADRRAVVFAGSQKTLPIGLLVAEATGLPFAIIPMLLFHASQLFLDTWIADRLARRATDPVPSEQPAVETG